MDFKSRYPDLTYWPESEEEDTVRFPFPYDLPNDIHLLEIDAPDSSTQFLATPVELIEGEQFSLKYLIEAPRNCPMRREFEFGHLSWREFWFHRGWLIEHKSGFLTRVGAHVRYVHPSILIAKQHEYFMDPNFASPMLFKLRALEEASSLEWLPADVAVQYEMELADFIEKYPEIVLQNQKRPKVA